ncbi:MAG: hypothetical protein ABI321_24975 [Polyangia bacterium]
MKATALALAATLLFPVVLPSSAAYADDALPDERIVVGRDDDGRASIDHAHFSRSGEALSGPRLFEALGRVDLADRYRARRATRRALIGTGVGVAALGALCTLPVVALGAIGIHDGDRHLLAGGAIGLGVSLALGIALTVGGSRIRSAPVGERTTRRLIDRFNLTVQPAAPAFGTGEI